MTRTSEWISVDDRLPDSGVDVLVLRGANCSVAGLDVYGDWEPACIDSGYDMSEASLAFKPTHWQPLPPPPIV